MGNRWGKFGIGSDPGDSDLELLRERVLDHADDEDAVSGNDIDNSSSTGPIKVVVKQDGIGRTGGIVLGVFAGCAFGVAIMTLVITQTSYRELERETRLNTQATDDMRASLIARGINPNNHDITDEGGDKP